MTNTQLYFATGVPRLPFWRGKMLLAKFYEHDTNIAHLRNKTGL